MRADFLEEGLARWLGSGRLWLLRDEEKFSPMTNRVVPAPQDFQKMCKQAERDHESKKLVVLIDRVKRQIAERNSGVSTVEGPKPPVTALSGDSGVFRLPSRSAIFER